MVGFLDYNRIVNLGVTPIARLYFFTVKKFLLFSRGIMVEVQKYMNEAYVLKKKDKADSHRLTARL